MRVKGMVALVSIIVPLVLMETAYGQQAEHKAVVLVRTKEGSRGWLGVSIADMTRSLAKEKDLKVEEGALVRGVEDDTPADSAGIKEGDVIVEYDGKRISDASDLSKAVGKTKPGTVVTIALMRNNEKKSLKATIGEAPRESRVRMFTVPPVPHISRAPHPFGRSSVYGLSLLELNQQLGEYFEAPGGKGVLVERVKRNGEGEKAGFKAGDVIIRVGKETIADVDDIWEALEDYKDGEKAEVEVLRKGARKTLTLTVDESAHGFGYNFRFNGGPFDEKFMDFDIDMPDKGEIENFKHQSEHLKLDMDKLKRELQEIPKHINEGLKGLQEKLRDAFVKARLSRNV